MSLCTSAVQTINADGHSSDLVAIMNTILNIDLGGVLVL